MALSGTRTYHGPYELRVLTHVSALHFAECGAMFTQKLVGMFQDIDISKDVMASFRQVRMRGPAERVSTLLPLFLGVVVRVD